MTDEKPAHALDYVMPNPLIYIKDWAPTVQCGQVEISVEPFSRTSDNTVHLWTVTLSGPGVDARFTHDQHVDSADDPDAYSPTRWGIESARVLSEVLLSVIDHFYFDSWLGDEDDPLIPYGGEDAMMTLSARLAGMGDSAPEST